MQTIRCGGARRYRVRWDRIANLVILTAATVVGLVVIAAWFDLIN